MSQVRGTPHVIHRGDDPKTLVLLKRHCEFLISRSLSDDLDVGQEYISIPYKFFNTNAYDKMLIQKWKAGKTPIQFIQIGALPEKYRITRIWKNKGVNFTVEEPLPSLYFQE